MKSGNTTRLRTVGPPARRCRNASREGAWRLSAVACTISAVTRPTGTLTPATTGACRWTAGRNGSGKPICPTRGHVSTAVLDGKIYALGGDHGHDVTQIDVPSCHRYDPAAKKWSEIAPLPDGRSHFEGSTIVYQGRILIVGGRCNSSKPPRGVVGDILQYDPAANIWQAAGEMPEKVLAPSAAILAGRLVVTGGGLNNPRPLTAATWVAPLPAGK